MAVLCSLQWIDERGEMYREQGEVVLLRSQCIAALCFSRAQCEAA